MYHSGDLIRLHTESLSTLPEEKYRSEFRRDYARIIHSHSFRRLQGKQQLYPGLESDFFRSRLTHSLEVAQIAKAIGIRLNSEYKLNIDCDLLEVAGTAHDIGHPPFGHKGEYALDDLMKAYGGFEGNAQTLRVLSKLEKKIHGHRVGLNLTSRSLASILKYNNIITKERAPSDPIQKGYYDEDKDLVENVKKNVLSVTSVPEDFRTIECCIMDLADDIAYSVFDFEDGLKAGFYTFFDLLYSHDFKDPNNVLEKVTKKLTKKGIPGITTDSVLKTMETELYSLLGRDKFFSTQDILNDISSKGLSQVESWIKFLNSYYYSLNLAYGKNGALRTQTSSFLVGKFIRGIDYVPNSAFPQLSSVQFNTTTLLQVETLKQFVYEFIVSSPRLLISELRGQDIVKEIFSAIIKNPRLLPSDYYSLYKIETIESAQKRIICDFVSGMTDRYAIEFYGRLKSMDPVTIFKQY